MMQWRDFAARSALAAAMVGVAVFAGMRLATADPGGPTRDGLTFAGVLRDIAGAPVNGSVTLTFVFRKGTGALPGEVCRATSTTNASNGAFSVGVPITSCPRQLFDGGDVSYDVLVGGETAPIASNVAVTPVPYARFADQVGVNNDCPAGYELSAPDGYWTVESGRRLCIRYLDPGRRYFEEVVRVGRGASAFWIDRFESSVYGQLNGGGPNYGAVGDDYGDGFPDNGQWTPMNERYALSIQQPVRTGSPNPNAPAQFITWFQANVACRLAGKRLPTADEWLMAAQGTPDPGSDTGDSGGCRTAMGGRSGDSAREAGQSNSCRSRWGAHDMIGNVAEWTAEWFAAPGIDGISYANTWADYGGSGSSYGRDLSFNIASQALGAATPVQGLPSAAVRGGYWNDGERAGIFTIDLRRAPTSSNIGIGFRCVISR